MTSLLDRGGGLGGGGGVGGGGGWGDVAEHKKSIIYVIKLHATLQKTLFQINLSYEA
jgi:hypothetical protein